MVYIGLEFGSWFEVPWNSPCYQAVRGVNPVLQLIFTFSQMYFVFMNSRVSFNSIITWERSVTKQILSNSDIKTIVKFFIKLVLYFS